MRKLRYSALLILCMVCTTVQAQYVPVTSQYLFNGLVINPAYAGSQEAFCASISHRSQWVGIDGAPNTQNISFHGPLKNENIALGAMIYRDAIGVTRENALYTQYAYRMRMSGGFLSFGLGAGVSMYKSNWNEVPTTDPNDPVFINPSPVFIKPNVSFGTYFYNKKLFGGLSVPFVLSHKLNQAGTRYQVYNDFKNYNVMLQVGTYAKLSDAFTLKPSILLKKGPGGSYQADATLQGVIQNRYSLGVSYRTSNAVVCMLQMRMNDQWFAGYSFDYTFSALRNYQYGSHEVLLRYLFYYKVNARSPRYF